MPQAIRVLMDGVSGLILDYAVPGGTSPDILPGCRIQAPLRGRMATGTVLAIFEASPERGNELKPFLRLIDPEPLISPALMELARWAADYYAVPMEQMIRCLLPETVRQENTSGKTRKMLRLLKTPEQHEREELGKKAPRQRALLDMLLERGSEPLSLQEAGGTGMLEPARSLVRRGWIEIFEQNYHRDPCQEERFAQTRPIPLNDQQQEALDFILNNHASQDRKPILLQGVTGSGKTEVYLQAVERVVAQGQSALILVPEISLTPQTLQRFKSRFASLPGSVAVLHSQLSAGERFDEWHSIRQGKARIAIGPRSAVFAPMQNLGIIIVDEEHDNSYKQETSPRYHGRDLAVLRAKLEHASVVLGSATPSMESTQNARSGKYKKINLVQRADGQKMPLIRILDMRTEGRKSSGITIISERLRMAVDDRLKKEEQVILLLNRRGFARSLQCQECGFVSTCPHCSLPLTFHKEDNRLVCHMCGYQALPPLACPECQSKSILLQGYGTEKVEEVVRKLFPQGRVARIDADVSRRKNAVRDILNDFRAHKIDILLGTQMIAKGLDFPNVTLVGVLNADISLHIPDLRASERTFQLMTQVAGRAGRGDIDGEVIIQTFTPQAPAIQYARHHDCDGFAEQELEQRQVFHLPPFSHIALLTARSPNEDLAEFTAKTIYQRIAKAKPPELEATEPMPAPILKANGQFRYQITLKALRARIIAKTVVPVLEELKLGSQVTVVLDIDAYSFM